jgi:hypothetical protein
MNTIDTMNKQVRDMITKVDKLNAKMDSNLRQLKLRSIMQADRMTPSVKADIIDVLKSIAKDA